jgi:ABC-type multidrug transport system ATPase subunit
MLNVQIQNVSKIYAGNNIGVKDITLELHNGMFGLLGPNGAGKTTLMRMIATLLSPTSGDIRVNGHSVRSEPKAIRSILGYLPQDSGVYPNLSAREFLDYFAILDGIRDYRERKEAVGQALEVVGLTSVAEKRLKTFSGGMRQRIGIAQTLLRPHEFLIVDEPTAGLDPEERIRFRNLLSEISGNKLVILSTHIVADIETTCDDLAIIKQGSVLVRSSPSELTRSIQNKVWEMMEMPDGLATLKQKFQVISVVRKADGVYCRVLSENKPSENSQVVSPTLEDAYVYLLH